ncbi:MAG: hypothetical protein M0P69_18200 [Bacteroidales bacterium]|nr:hypothetical protein [Bacteroidales bacterium]
MMRYAIILVAAATLSASAQTSNVQRVRAWTRTYIMGVPGGQVLDPTGKIAPAQRYEAVAASVIESSNLVAAAETGLDAALGKLYAVTGRVDEFSSRIYIAADMEEDPGYENLQGSVIGETVDQDGTVHYFCHYSRLLASPPKTRWAFDIAPGVILWADGVVATNNILTDCGGYDCYDISVRPPTGIGNVVLRAEKYMRIGAPDKPLNIDDAGINLIVDGIEREAFTGDVVYTNEATCFTEIYLAGTLYQVTTNAINGGQL